MVAPTSSWSEACNEYLEEKRRGKTLDVPVRRITRQVGAMLFRSQYDPILGKMMDSAAEQKRVQCENQITNSRQLRAQELELRRAKNHDYNIVTNQALPLETQSNPPRTRGSGKAMWNSPPGSILLRGYDPVSCQDVQRPEIGSEKNVASAREKHALVPLGLKNRTFDLVSNAAYDPQETSKQQEVILDSFSTWKKDRLNPITTKFYDRRKEEGERYKKLLEERTLRNTVLTHNFEPVDGHLEREGYAYNIVTNECYHPEIANPIDERIQAPSLSRSRQRQRWASFCSNEERKEIENRERTLNRSKVETRERWKSNPEPIRYNLPRSPRGSIVSGSAVAGERGVNLDRKEQNPCASTIQAGSIMSVIHQKLARRLPTVSRMSNGALERNHGIITSHERIMNQVPPQATLDAHTFERRKRLERSKWVLPPRRTQKSAEP